MKAEKIWWCPECKSMVSNIVEVLDWAVYYKKWNGKEYGLDSDKFGDTQVSCGEMRDQGGVKMQCGAPLELKQEEVTDGTLRKEER